MDHLRFVAVSMTGFTLAECYDLHRCVLRVVHDHNTVNLGDRVALAYPDYRLGITTDATSATNYGEEQRLIGLRKGSLGRSVCVFGLEPALREITDTLAVPLGDIAGVTIGQPALAPTGGRYVVYTAHKGMANMTPSRLRRAIRRRAWERDPTCLTPPQLERKQIECQKQMRDTPLPNITVQSRSNGQTFSIFVKWNYTDALCFNPNSFGLSTVTQPCAIPDLSDR